VSLLGGQVRVQDMGSTNGTFIDGIQVDDEILKPESRLQLGEIILKVEYLDAQEKALDEKIFEDATTDALTKVPNRRWFEERARAEVASAQRSGRFLHLVMFDIDFFKRVNDDYGHQAGDFILQEVAQVLKRALREEDLMGRYGGEEFILLLRESSPQGAWKVADRIREAIEGCRLIFEGQRIPVTASMGLCSRIGSDVQDLEHLIAAADQALYKAKEQGRNQVVSAQ
jgi:diguanylate cyclase (GGDEF)-like protein